MSELIKHHINEVMDMHCLTRGKMGYSVVYYANDVDKVIADKDKEIKELKDKNRRLKCALWLARAERYKMSEFIAREEGNLRDQIAWSQYLRERTYNQWVAQLLRIANLANKLQNKCRAKSEEYR